MLHRLAKSLRAFAEKDGRGYPDWALRYVPITHRLQTRKYERGPTLEIGANENGFSRFAHVPVIAVDISQEHLRSARDAQDITPVLADITALPFRDAAFKTVVCVDTFEHITNDQRKEAVGEIGRVLTASGAAAIAFPSSDAAARAEERVCRAYAKRTGGKIKWLEEHRETGLPNPQRIGDLFRDRLGKSHRVTRSKNANLRCWTALWLILMCGWPGRGNALFQALLRLATPLLCRAHFGVCYRTMIWVEPIEQRP